MLGKVRDEICLKKIVKVFLDRLNKLSQNFSRKLIQIQLQKKFIKFTKNQLTSVLDVIVISASKLIKINRKAQKNMFSFQGVKTLFLGEYSF